MVAGVQRRHPEVGLLYVDGDADLPTAFLRVADPGTRGLPASARRNSPVWEIIRRAFLEAVT